jgi:Fur family ferric uptake transcriptional regulator
MYDRAVPRTKQPPSLGLPERVRRTRQRTAVLAAIERAGGSFTLVDLYDSARETVPHLGLATVYRTVELLRREGLVRPVSTDMTTAGRPEYMRCHPGHHHHLVCTTCGAVVETDLCAAPADEELRKRYGFVAEGHTVDFYGTCGSCA